MGLELEELAGDGGEKGAGVGAPFTRGATLAFRDQRSGELIDVIRVFKFGEGVPAVGLGVGGVQDYISAVWCVEVVQVSGIGVGDHGVIAAREGLT
jgi:hypothetical protein